jgi:hypothetical protein
MTLQNHPNNFSKNYRKILKKHVQMYKKETLIRGKNQKLKRTENISEQLCVAFRGTRMVGGKMGGATFLWRQIGESS